MELTVIGKLKGTVSRDFHLCFLLDNFSWPQVDTPRLFLYCCIFMELFVFAINSLVNSSSWNHFELRKKSNSKLKMEAQAIP
jgi:hypothetical protein